MEISKELKADVSLMMEEVILSFKLVSDGSEGKDLLASIWWHLCAIAYPSPPLAQNVGLVKGCTFPFRCQAW